MDESYAYPKIDSDCSDPNRRSLGLVSRYNHRIGGRDMLLTLLILVSEDLALGYRI